MTQQRDARRRKTGGQQPRLGHPLGTPSSGLTPNTGPLASAAWLVARELTPPRGRWHVEVLLGTSPETPDDNAPTVLRVELYSEEWGFFFRHDGKDSWIRVTDVPFVHGRDDHGLLVDTPALKNFGSFVRGLESRFSISFVPRAAAIRSSLPVADDTIRHWIETW